MTSSRLSQPKYWSSHLETKNDGPNESQNDPMISVHNIVISNILHGHLFLPQKVNSSLNVLHRVNSHAPSCVWNFEMLARKHVEKPDQVLSVVQVSVKIVDLNALGMARKLRVDPFCEGSTLDGFPFVWKNVKRYQAKEHMELHMTSDFRRRNWRIVMHCNI